MVTLRQLEVFLAVCDADGSVTRAATALYVSQPSVSDTLRSLERELGARLFAGRGRSRGLSPAGRVFESHARRVFAVLREGRQAVADLEDHPAGRLDVVAVPTAGESFVPVSLSRFSRRHPDVEITLRVANRAESLGPLLDGAADLVVMGRPPSELALGSRVIRPNDLHLVAAPDHELAGRPVDRGGLARATLLLREPGSGTRSAVEQALDELGLRPGRTMVLGSNAAIVAGVRQRLGVAVLPAVAVETDLGRGDLVALEAPGFPLRRAWYAVWPASRAPSAPARAFVDQLVADASGAGTVGAHDTPTAGADAGASGGPG